MSPTQKAIVVSELGKPVTLVKVAVAGLNPHDQKSRDWGLFILRDLTPVPKDYSGDTDLPSVPTNDVVGRITKLGPGVTDLAIGDRIVYQPSFAPGSKQNGLQEYALAELGALTKIPDSITDDEAATLPTNIIAPLVALFDALQIPAPWLPAAKDFDYANTTILIVGGGSNCGQFGVQLAKLANIGRIVVVGGDEAKLRSFGATHVIDRYAGYEMVLTKIRDIVGDDLVYAYDSINPAEGQLLALNALSSSKRGALARLIPRVPVDESKVLGKRAGFDVRDVFGSSQVHPELAAGFWSRVPSYLESRQIKPLAYVVKRGLTAENVNEVLDAYRDGKSVAKTHIHL
ncbi:alcohol dehydrogenase, zinc-containing, putative [Talaromyces stipitatus ATCC 10500]|uniref:Alcohol dehydrogenase, zinc-containing, putative n=1 Tax=Talaromyces stipitatus (strain ATCC 10500 / CBS 375.48 / QM 6759 / NRRL 1006) TaxID=441959 RepID=B8MRB4_TALSN|nr:alcohol dehydrogenase, zinc-containing, putative [Talaromyces stipitatus ATCC 10500]EED13009.1 alcohol dehydrogenase, zinc-containing, putative [Talaromyces stipitatus ATCC 10500]